MAVRKQFNRAAAAAAAAAAAVRTKNFEIFL
jgi:hypothetical protein